MRNAMSVATISTTLVVIPLFMSACGTYPPNAERLRKLNSLSFTQVSTGAFAVTSSQFSTSPKIYTINSNQEYSSLLASNSSLPSTLSVAFDTRTAIVEIASSQGSNGFALETLSIQDTSSNLIVNAILWHPSQAVLPTPMSPYCIVSIPKTMKVAQFGEIVEGTK